MPASALESGFAAAAALFAEKKFAEATASYASLAAMDDATDDDQLRAWNNMSACYASRNDYTRALECALESLKIDDGNIKALGRVATAYEGLLRYEDAAQTLERLLILCRGNPTLTSTYTESLQRVKEFLLSKRGIIGEESRKSFYYTKSLELGKAAMKDGNFVEAARQFRKAVELLPHDAPVREKAILLANRSAAFFRLSRFVESSDDAWRATEVDADYPRGFFRLACAKHKLHKYGDAFDALTRCLMLDPNHTEAAALIEEVTPLSNKERQTPTERAASAAQVVADIAEGQLNQMSGSGSVSVALPRAHAASYVYCTFCNEMGHVRSECPLRRREKRPRPT